jgi:hypothetical protein
LTGSDIRGGAQDKVKERSRLDVLDDVRDGLEFIKYTSGRGSAVVEAENTDSGLRERVSVLGNKERKRFRWWTYNSSENLVRGDHGSLGIRDARAIVGNSFVDLLPLGNVIDGQTTIHLALRISLHDKLGDDALFISRPSVSPSSEPMGKAGADKVVHATFETPEEFWVWVLCDGDNLSGRLDELIRDDTINRQPALIAQPRITCNEKEIPISQQIGAGRTV